MQIIRLSKVVFELETRALVTWCPSDDEEVFERQNADERLRGSTNSNSSRTLLLKGEMRHVQSLDVVIFLCKPL